MGQAIAAKKWKSRCFHRGCYIQEGLAMNNRAERRRQECETKKIRKTLTSGDGVFWDLKSDGIHLKSKKEEPPEIQGALKIVRY